MQRIWKPFIKQNLCRAIILWCKKFLPVHLTNLGCPPILILTWGGAESVSESVRVWVTHNGFAIFSGDSLGVWERFCHAASCCCWWYMTNIRNKRVFQKDHWTKFWWWSRSSSSQQQQQQQQQRQISKFVNYSSTHFINKHFLLWCFSGGAQQQMMLQPNQLQFMPLPLSFTPTTDDATKPTISAQFMPPAIKAFTPTPK